MLFVTVVKKTHKKPLVEAAIIPSCLNWLDSLLLEEAVALGGLKEKGKKDGVICFVLQCLALHSHSPTCQHR